MTTEEKEIARIAAEQHVTPEGWMWDGVLKRSYYVSAPPPKPSRRTIREYLALRSTSYRDDGLEMPLSEFAEWVAELQDATPEGIEPTVSLEYESDYDGPGEAQFCVYYDREETDEEFAQREASTLRELTTSANREYTEYQRLKAKFG